jgi:folate-binding protein YgfZ
VTNPLLERPGGVLADPPDDGPDGVAAHYGDPLREQRHLEQTAGWVDRGNRGVIRLVGPDRLSWLHSLSTQHVEQLAAGQGAQTLILSPQGHVEHHLVLADDGEFTWIDVEPGTVAALAKFLESMRFMLRVDPVDLSAAYAVLSVMGPQTDAVLAASDLTVGTPDYAVSTSDGIVVRRMPGSGVDLIVPRSRAEAVIDALELAGAQPAGMWAYEALRVAARRPRFGLDTDHRTLPHEVGWIETAVHLDKGCYRGQETVARVHNLGRPPRRLVFLHLDGSDEQLPVHGTPVTVEDNPVGFIGTPARHHELGPIALALIKRSTPVDAALLVDGNATSAEVIVDPDAGLHVRSTL